MGRKQNTADVQRTYQSAIALHRRGLECLLDPDRPIPKAEPSFILRNLPYLHIRFDPR